MNFPITMSYQTTIIVHSSNPASASLVLSINTTVAGLRNPPQWQALEILEDKSDMQTLIVSRICGQKQHLVRGRGSITRLDSDGQRPAELTQHTKYLYISSLSKGLCHLLFHFEFSSTPLTNLGGI